MNEFLVSIFCITYNHSTYITDTMDGFVMQQTNFPFVAVIIDDASTDGEQEVIKAYVEEHFDHSQESGFREWETEDAFFSFARHKENKNCHFVAVCLKRNLFKEPEKKDAVVKGWFEAKYMALCEGDDYWIDPLKLQKQVDFLEKHYEYDLCCAASKVYIQKNGSFTGVKGSVLCEKYTTIVQGYNDINTATVLTRMDVWKKCSDDLISFLPQEHIIDTAYWYWFAYHEKIKYMPEQMAVYRVLENSACHTKDKEKGFFLDLNFLSLKLAFLLRYPLSNGHKEVVDNIVKEIETLCNYSRYLGESEVRNTRAYKIGRSLKKLKFFKS